MSAQGRRNTSTTTYPTYTSGSECKWSDRDELGLVSIDPVADTCFYRVTGANTHHTRALHVSRQLLRHETVDEGRRNHEGNQTARSLRSGCAQGYGRFVDGERMSSDVCGVDKVRRERTCEQEWVGRENPSRCHHVDGKYSLHVRRDLV